MNDFAVRGLLAAVHHEWATPVLVRLGATTEEIAAIRRVAALVVGVRRPVDALSELATHDKQKRVAVFHLIRISSGYPTHAANMESFRWDDVWRFFDEHLNRVRPPIPERGLQSVIMLVDAYGMLRAADDVVHLHDFIDDEEVADSSAFLSRLISFELENRLWGTIASVLTAEEVQALRDWGEAIIVKVRRDRSVPG